MSVVFDPSDVLAALRRTGRVYVCLVFDVPAVPGGSASIVDVPTAVITNVARSEHQSALLRQGAEWILRQELEELHRGKQTLGN